jgi:hypothetical protein
MKRGRPRVRVRGALLNSAINVNAFTLTPALSLKGEGAQSASHYLRVRFTRKNPSPQP